MVFEKGEAVRYVGHLDILRTFIRALKRADIPLKYSEGFNPHAIMSFALPLGVGVTSECEIVDITLKDDLPAESVIAAVNANMPHGAVRVLSGNYTAASPAEIVRAEYVIRIRNSCPINSDDLSGALAQKEIMADKKGKKAVKQINVMEHIFESEILELSDNECVLRLVISAGNTFNLKPQLVVAALVGAAHIEPVAVLPHRKRFITAS